MLRSPGNPTYLIVTPKRKYVLRKQVTEGRTDGKSETAEGRKEGVKDAMKKEVTERVKQPKKGSGDSRKEVYTIFIHV